MPNIIKYPPILPDEIIPIAILPKEENKRNLKIEFVNNPAVNLTEVTGIAVKILDYYNNSTITKFLRRLDENEKINGVRDIKTTNKDMQKDTPYKIQIAYVNLTFTDVNSVVETSIPYEDFVWSTAATGWCIGEEPEITIYTNTGSNGDENKEPNILARRLRAKITNQEKTEPIYKYRFTLTGPTSNGGIEIKEQGDWSFNTSNSWVYSYRLYFVPKYTTNGYKVKFEYQTVNGYIDEKVVDMPAASKINEPTIKIKEMKNDTQNGGIVLTFNDYSKPFVIERKKESSNDEEFYYVLKRLDAVPESKTWTDYSVGQGELCSYRVQEYNPEKFIYTSHYHELTEKINCDFEHMILSDKDKQLIIAFNPQVSSFKYTILENKVDTIGGRYPVFTRNGQVKYAEIPISGLISYHMDSDELFMTKSELGLSSEDMSTSLTAKNIAAERKFRTAVYEWLNNGKPKVLRTPTEGNFIVRLMNISLSPNQQLSRMLYTFSATGYEVMEYNYKNLLDNDLIFEG